MNAVLASTHVIGTQKGGPMTIENRNREMTWKLVRRVERMLSVSPMSDAVVGWRISLMGRRHGDGDGSARLNAAS